MACEKRIRTFISKTVLVSGKYSAIKEHDFYEIGLLPRYGDTNEVLAKCSPKDYHTYWIDVNSLITPDTDWVETVDEVYNDTKPIGIGTATPFPNNALTVNGNMNQYYNCNFLAVGEGVYTPLFPANYPVTVGGVQDIFTTGEYSYFASYKNDTGNYFYEAKIKNEVGPGFNENSVEMNSSSVLLKKTILGGGTDEIDSVEILQGQTVITSFDNALMQGRQYVFPTTGGMEMLDYTSALIYKMPNVDGANLEVLTTDGSGNLYWSNAGGIGAIVTADNGLNVNPANNVQLGGPLILPTNVTSTGVNFLSLESGLDSSIHLYVDESLVEIAAQDNRITLNDSNQMLYSTPFYVANTNSYVTPGKLLQNIDETNGEVEFTPFTFPLVDGSPNQVLSTNGAGAITFNNVLGTLIQAGPGLTESPVGTIKLGDVDIQSTENLSVANGAYWEVNDPVTVADVDVALGIGTHPTYSTGAYLTSNNTSTLRSAVVGTLADQTAIMYNTDGTIERTIILESGGVIRTVIADPAIVESLVQLSLDGIRIQSDDKTNTEFTLIDVYKNQPVEFAGNNGVISYNYQFPDTSGLAGQVLLRAAGADNPTEWASAPSAWTDNLYTADGFIPGDRIVNGSGNIAKLYFQEFDLFSITNTNNIIVAANNDIDITAPNSVDVESNALKLKGSVSLSIEAPAFASTQLGWVLKAQSAGTGLADWEELKHVLPFVILDWAPDIIILESTHGKGTDPIIQVFNDAGAMEIPGVGALTSIVVNPSGDVTLSSGAPFDGKVVIM